MIACRVQYLLAGCALVVGLLAGCGDVSEPTTTEQSALLYPDNITATYTWEWSWPPSFGRQPLAYNCGINLQLTRTGSQTGTVGGDMHMLPSGADLTLTPDNWYYYTANFRVYDPAQGRWIRFNCTYNGAGAYPLWTCAAQVYGPPWTDDGTLYLFQGC